MSLEEGLIESYVFNSNHMFFIEFNDLIYQQERVTVWQYIGYSLDIIHRWFGRIILWNIGGIFYLFDMLLDLFCECNIACMAGPVGNDMGFERKPYQGKITHQVQ